MGKNDLEEVEENLRVLIREELDTQHRLEGHPQPVDGCPVCASIAAWTSRSSDPSSRRTGKKA